MKLEELKTRHLFAHNAEFMVCANAALATDRLKYLHIQDPPAFLYATNTSQVFVYETARGSRGGHSRQPPDFAAAEAGTHAEVCFLS